MFAKVLLAVDGSEHGQRAARTAGDLVRAVKSPELHIVVAYEPIPGYLGEPHRSQAIEARSGHAEHILRQAREAIGRVPAELHTQTTEGSIAEAILDVAVAQKGDLIVMGSRGFGRLEGALLGSNSQKVVSHAPCPVLIVR